MYLIFVDFQQVLKIKKKNLILRVEILILPIHTFFVCFIIIILNTFLCI